MIRQVFSQGAKSTLDLARLMSRARKSLPYGNWSRLWDSGELPFSKRKGEMLVVIGECVEGIDAQNSAQLPIAWNTLYYLARLGRKTMERLIEQGRIHPAITLQEAQELLIEHHPQLRRKGRRTKLQNRLRRLAEYIRLNCRTWSEAEREIVCSQLTVLAGEIQMTSTREMP